MAIKDRDQMQDGEKSKTFESGDLWSKVLNSTRHAIRNGALRHIPTHQELIAHDQVHFLVRIIANPTNRDAYNESMQKARGKGRGAVDPFLPHEADLFVADLSESHLVVLNKFNVVHHHSLIITRAFESQHSLLTLRDFQAVWTCLAEVDGLVFYNSGPIAGSSQPHKHLQLIPLPMVPGEPRVLTEALITAGLGQDLIGHSPKLPFAHSITPTTLDGPNAMQSAAKESLQRYHTMIRATGLHVKTVENTQISDPYNLLITRQWMLLVPRRAESFESISINALGFAGALLVKNSRQLQTLKQVGPMKILQQVALPE